MQFHLQTNLYLFFILFRTMAFPMLAVMYVWTDNLLITDLLFPWFKMLRLIHLVYLASQEMNFPVTIFF